MKPKLPALSERDIQGHIIDYLRLKQYYVQRLNAGEYSLGEGKGYVKGVEAGTPDIMAFKPYPSQAPSSVVLYFIEVKKPGEEPNEKQQAKMQELESYGAICLVATCVEDVQKAGL